MAVASYDGIKINNLYHEYVAGKPILKGINIDIDQPGIIAIIGPSGTGKSTLLRCINRLNDPTRGEILFDGVDLTQLKGYALRMQRRHIGMVFQEYNLVERLTVIENVLSGRLGYMSAWNAWRRRYSSEDLAKAFELLEFVGLEDFANQRADSLSGGQRQRVGIARAVMQNPYILLADEPTSSLDPKTASEIMGLMETLAEQKNIPVLVNIHDVNLAKKFAKRVIGMCNGKVHYDGTPEGITEDDLKVIYGGESWLD
ncbi:phosphonate ABC transporter ATP-binding protein [Enterovibrio norvegicus]|uniref:Phosphonate transport system ATP-binding protein n=1 Tax=Enterovibrio norvegicus DSM 15893 TaxID=1121869 RepID=A0A1I5U2X6_9GAMM|nr:phosphonate ABC transporter ATP-binding protein [Enterovibrio norvegicus]MCC4800047.1 phosphonate ABC transporter ATP-binding protein [Enterovibrio norvegicus]OEE51089.1 phosphonate ABC transporter ATP-binding protein [Enterovibrio norvegicus]PMH70407.1 phosphonate ABC transporter ATP-binding protein [Enterovibrio norvegicus]PMI32696.1 phosphonate ABC transporter ATP-binding protein [Enterovibrio norvegicus]PMN52873.1 phosphonate ABC transporter ATP-binding protein [Enterovibrio norvegicus]